MANIQRTHEQWQQIFEQHAASGLQIATFCKQQKITPSSFYTWRKRLARYPLCPSVTDEHASIANEQADWLGMIPEQIVTPSSWDIELALPNGVVLRMMNH